MPVGPPRTRAARHFWPSRRPARPARTRSWVLLPVRRWGLRRLRGARRDRGTGRTPRARLGLPHRLAGSGTARRHLDHGEESLNPGDSAHTRPTHYEFSAHRMHRAHPVHPCTSRWSRCSNPDTVLLHFVPRTVHDGRSTQRFRPANAAEHHRNVGPRRATSKIEPTLYVCAVRRFDALGAVVPDGCIGHHLALPTDLYFAYLVRVSAIGCSGDVPTCSRSCQRRTGRSRRRR